MKVPFAPKDLPVNSVLLACSSHEGRCKGVISRIGSWRPKAAALFHYDDPNPRREENHREMELQLTSAGVRAFNLPFTEGSAVKSLRDNMEALRSILANDPEVEIVFDITVFTKRHLLMMLRWLDDEGYWDRLTVAYSEPEDYDVSEHIPLSFGLASFQEVPGFAACPDLSRPLHLVMFLGFEGDRALAVYEHVQPMQTTLVVPYPPYKSAWIGRSESLNAEILAIVGSKLTEKVDAIDPEEVRLALARILGPATERSQCARVIAPLGTKPQTLGIYSYVRACVDSPAVVYASPLRHNHEFFSHGTGSSWILKRGEA